MSEKNSRKALALAIVWSIITVGTAAGIIWALPTLAPLPLLLFGVSLVNAFVAWGVFFHIRGHK